MIRDAAAVLDLKMKKNEDSDIRGYQDDSALEIIPMGRTRESKLLLMHKLSRDG